MKPRAKPNALRAQQRRLMKARVRQMRRIEPHLRAIAREIEAIVDNEQREKSRD